MEQQVPRLSLRGTATPIIAKELAISGFDNGKVMAVSLNTGDTVWDTALASPHGRTELDRLVDIDSAVRVVGDDVFATGYQGRTAMLALDSGQIWWAHDMSSYRGLVVDDGEFVRDPGRWHGHRHAPARRLGNVAQRKHQTPRLEHAGGNHHRRGHRRLSRVICIGWTKRRAISWLANASSKSRVSNPPVAMGDTVVVLDDDGKMAAFRANPAACNGAASGSGPAAAQGRRSPRKNPRKRRSACLNSLPRAAWCPAARKAPRPICCP